MTDIAMSPFNLSLPLQTDAAGRKNAVNADAHSGTRENFAGQLAREKDRPAPFQPGLPLTPGHLATPPGGPVDELAVPPGQPEDQPAIPPERPSDTTTPSPFHEGKLPFTTNSEMSVSTNSTSSSEDTSLAANMPPTMAFLRWQPHFTWGSSDGTFG